MSEKQTLKTKNLWTLVAGVMISSGAWAQDSTLIERQTARIKGNSTMICHNPDSVNCFTPDPTTLDRRSNPDLSGINIHNGAILRELTLANTVAPISTSVPRIETKVKRTIASERYIKASEMKAAWDFSIKKNSSTGKLYATYMIPFACQALLEKSDSGDFSMHADYSQVPVKVSLFFNFKTGSDEDVTKECLKADTYKGCNLYWDQKIRSAQSQNKPPFAIDALRAEKKQKETTMCAAVSTEVSVDLDRVHPEQQKAVFGVAIPSEDRQSSVFEAGHTVLYQTPALGRYLEIQTQIATNCNVENPDEARIIDLESYLNSELAAVTGKPGATNAKLAQVIQEGKNKATKAKSKLEEERLAAKRAALLAPLAEDEKLKNPTTLLRELEKIASAEGVDDETREKAIEKQKEILVRITADAESEDIVGRRGILNKILKFVNKKRNREAVGFKETQRLIMKAVAKIEDADELEQALESITDSSWATYAEEKKKKALFDTIKYVAERVAKVTDGTPAQKSKAKAKILDKAVASYDSDEIRAMKIEMEAEQIAQKASFDGPLGQAFMQSMMGAGMGGMGMMGMLGNPMGMMFGFNSMMQFTSMELQMKSMEYLINRTRYCGANFAQFGISTANSGANSALCKASTNAYNQVTQAQGYMRMMDQMRRQMLSPTALGTGQTTMGPNAALVSSGNVHPRNRTQTRTTATQPGQQQQQAMRNGGNTTTIEVQGQGGRRRIRVPNQSRAAVGAP